MKVEEIESYATLVFQTIEQNAFFLLVGFVVVYYIYNNFVGDFLSNKVKEYKLSRAMNSTKNSIYKENESRSRSRLLEQYVAKDKKIAPVVKKKNTPSSSFSSRQYNPLTGSSGGGGYKPSRRQIRRGGG